MVIVGIFIVLLILVILLALQYWKIHTDALSREEFRIAAQLQTQKLKKEDPKITCDYCGTVIDTRIQKKCPNCGAPYGEDKEWSSRHVIHNSWINKNAKLTTNGKKRKASVEAGQKTKALRYAIVTLVCFIIMLIALIAAGTYFSMRTVSRRDESVNQNDYEHYIAANYHVLNNSTIFEHDDFTIRITGFYQDKKGDSYSPLKIEFTVENNTSKKQRVSMSSNSVNGLSGQTNLFIYDVFDPGTTVFYEKLYFVPGNVISEMVFDRISVQEEDTFINSYTTSDLIRVKTDAVMTEDTIQPEGNLIYTNDMVDVYSQDTEQHTGYKLWIQNKSSNDLKVDCKDLRVDGEKISYYGIYDLTIPGGYLFYENHLRIADEVFEGYENKKVELSLSFHCEKDPSLDFSTGYVELK